jgi:hypothetical protein
MVSLLTALTPDIAVTFAPLSQRERGKHCRSGNTLSLWERVRVLSESGEGL